MGTIADKLNYLNTTKTNIKNAIIEKGVTVETTDTFRDYATRISEIVDGSVEELTVTENGTYTGTEGVTYNPVNVNLPLGSKSVTANGTYTASDDSLQGYSEVTVDIDDTDLYRDTTDSTYESVKTLSNCGAFPMLSLKVGIEPIQEGSGDPSPTNVRPISGHTKANVVVSPTTDAEDGTTYTIQFKDGSNPLTVYGGSLDVVSGELTINKLGINVMSQEKRGWQIGSKSVCYRITLPQTATSCTPNQTHGAISNMMTEQLAYYGVSRPNDLDSINFAIDTSGVALAVYDTDLTLSEQQMISKYTDLFVVYPLATPLTIQLTPTQVKSLLGTNNVWADTGDVGDVRYFKKVEL